MKIQNLLEVKEDGQVSGPMSPVSFMQNMREHMGDNYNRLARVRFDDPKTLQVMEEGEGLTGYDHLILATQFENDLMLTLWVDTGTKAIPVGMMFESEWDLTITSTYEKAEFARKLTEGEIKSIFEYIIHNPGLIEPENIEQLA